MLPCIYTCLMMPSNHVTCGKKALTRHQPYDLRPSSFQHHDLNKPIFFTKDPVLGILLQQQNVELISVFKAMYTKTIQPWNLGYS